jgi:hypothetical protein
MDKNSINKQLKDGRFKMNNEQSKQINNELQKKIEIVKQENNKIEKENINFEFIEFILKNNIGNLVDDFLKTNSGQTITKYNSNMFALWIIDSIQKSKQEISNKINELINKKNKESECNI